MSKTILILVVVAVVAVGGFLLLRGGLQPAPTSNTTPPAVAPAPQETTPLPQQRNRQAPVPSSGGQPAAPQPPPAATGGNIQTTNAVVVYSDSGFSPATLRVKAGTAVTFTNQSSNQMWVASNPHPTHTDYPGFDARKAYATGQSYSFTFTQKGTWGYHNHLSPADGGTIIVE